MSAADRDSNPTTYSRRAAIGLGAAALAGAALAVEAAPGSAAAAAAGQDQPELLDALRPPIAPRSAWAADRPVTGPIEAEEDVRFLLVHHTASTNDYGEDEVVEQIRGFHQFHTGPEKGWPDVAYNFFVDRFGGIWEARQGSIDGPVRGDATGGSQGHALLCSLIGDHSQAPVSAEARTSMIALLAWLAERHGIDTEPGAMVEFVSRGSNRWPEGAQVRAATISGHRDMSETSCPGDFGYDLVTMDLPGAVSDRRRQIATALTTTSAPAPTLVAPEASTSSSEPAADPSTTTTLGSEDDQALAGPDDGDSIEASDLIVPAALASGAATVVTAAMAARRRRSPEPPPS